MQTKLIVPETYYRARLHGQEPETVRALEVVPNGDPRLEWRTGPHVLVRRFKVSGYLDILLRPHDMVDEAQPDTKLLAMFRHIEDEVGPFQREQATHAGAIGTGDVVKLDGAWRTVTSAELHDETVTLACGDDMWDIPAGQRLQRRT